LRIPLDNIILIGMPGAGKSTVGVILAKTLGMRFIDTDIVLQEQAGRLLQEMIGNEGTTTFLKTEEKTLLSLQCQNAVIATGGSAVFSHEAMEHLATGGIVIYLKISFEEMVRRLRNITTRGIVLFEGQDLREMYDLRAPLYENYAGITLECSGTGAETIVEGIVQELQKYRQENSSG
jgi:shikimate kinase